MGSMVRRSNPRLAPDFPYCPDPPSQPPVQRTPGPSPARNLHPYLYLPSQRAWNLTGERYLCFLCNVERVHTSRLSSLKQGNQALVISESGP